MKRLTFALLIVLVLTVVGSAGYLGMQGVQGKALPTVQPPTTVSVTRGTVQQTVTAPGRLINIRQVTLAAEICGRVAKLNVRPGDQIQAGDVLAQFATAPFEEELISAQADLEMAQARLVQVEAGPSSAELVAAQYALVSAETLLSQLQAGPSTAEIAAAEADVASARNDLAYRKSLPRADNVAQAQAELDCAKVTLQQAQAAYDQVKDRPDVGMLPQALELQKATITFNAARAAFGAANRPATPAELEAARARLASAQAKLAQIQAGPSGDELRLAEIRKSKAEAELAQLTASPLAADLKQAQMAVQAARRALEKAQADLVATNLTAPFDGIVLELRAGPLETVCSGEGLIVMIDPTAVEIESTVIEEDLPLVQAGQRVELFFDAQPGALVSGYVSRIVPQRKPGSDRPLYPVYVAPDELPRGLAPGMTVDASIILARRTDVLRLPRALAHARPDGTAQVKVWAEGQIELRTVKVGLRGDVHIEILEGLHEGEQVVGQ